MIKVRSMNNEKLKNGLYNTDGQVFFDLSEFSRFWEIHKNQYLCRNSLQKDSQVV